MKLLLNLTLILLISVTSIGSAIADINIFLGDLNNQAYVNRDDYRYRLSHQFGVPMYQVDSLLRRVNSPADAFMTLYLGRILNIPHERVWETYEANRGHGWGVTAQRLGIKPGSPEFHALKNGNLSFTGKPNSNHWKNDHEYEYEHGNGKQKKYDLTNPTYGHLELEKGKSKGKGHNK
jgi:hypothetical protein